MSRTYAARRPSSTEPSSATVMSSMIRTPWPSRSAPHHWIASQIDGSPNASPAWIVKWRVLALEVLERVEVPGGRVAGLGAGDVEAGHAAVAPGDGELGDLAGAGLVPHRGEQLAHRDPALGPAGHALLEALLDGGDDLVEGQPGGDVLLGRVADLGVDDAVRGQVLDALAGHPGQRGGGLHDRDGVVEGLEVAHQRAGVGHRREPRAQRLRVGRGQRCARPRRPARRWSRAAARRRGGRAAAPSAPAGPAPG